MDLSDALQEEEAVHIKWDFPRKAAFKGCKLVAAAAVASYKHTMHSRTLHSFFTTYHYRNKLHYYLLLGKLLLLLPLT